MRGGSRAGDGPHPWLQAPGVSTLGVHARQARGRGEKASCSLRNGRHKGKGTGWSDGSCHPRHECRPRRTRVAAADDRDGVVAEHGRCAVAHSAGRDALQAGRQTTDQKHSGCSARKRRRAAEWKSSRGVQHHMQLRGRQAAAAGSRHRAAGAVPPPHGRNNAAATPQHSCSKPLALLQLPLCSSHRFHKPTQQQ